MTPLRTLPLGAGVWIRPWLFVLRTTVTRWSVECSACGPGGVWIHEPRSRNGVSRALREHWHCAPIARPQ